MSAIRSSNLATHPVGGERLISSGLGRVLLPVVHLLLEFLCLLFIAKREAC